MAQTTITADEFKAKCLTLIDEIHESGAEIVITKCGRPVARLVPAASHNLLNIFGHQKRCMRIAGDIISPIDVEWDATK